MTDKVAKRIKDEINVITRKEADPENARLFGEFNKVFVSGIIDAEFELSHQDHGEKFYQTRVRTKRTSGKEDIIPVIVSYWFIEEAIKDTVKDKWVEVTGELRTRNIEGEDGKKHLEIYLFASELIIYDEKEQLVEEPDINLIYLEGFLCKPPVFRTTPLGRQITDILIAVNRPFGKSDYIPCVVWMATAKWARHFEIGDKVRLFGRIQSRTYFKKPFPDAEEGEERTAYEVSVAKMERVK